MNTSFILELDTLELTTNLVSFGHEVWAQHIFSKLCKKEAILPFAGYRTSNPLSTSR